MSANSAHATIDERGTPRLRGIAVKDCRTLVLAHLRKHPRTTFGIGQFGITREQTEWALAKLAEEGRIERVTGNGWRLSDEKSAAAKKPEPTAPEADDDAKRKSRAHFAISASMKHADAILEALRTFEKEALTVAQISDLIGVTAERVRPALWRMRTDGEIIAFTVQRAGTRGQGGFTYALPSHPDARNAVPASYRRTAAVKNFLVKHEAQKPSAQLQARAKVARQTAAIKPKPATKPLADVLGTVEPVKPSAALANVLAAVDPPLHNFSKADKDAIVAKIAATKRNLVYKALVNAGLFTGDMKAFQNMLEKHRYRG